LDVHHIVPRGRAGSNCLSNLVTLCRQCHDAAHGKSMAPRVKFDRGAMNQEEFDLYLEFWKNSAFGEIAIFDGTEQYWCVPKVDMEQLLEESGSISGPPLPIPSN